MILTNNGYHPVIDRSSLFTAAIFDHFLDSALKANHINEKDTKL